MDSNNRYRADLARWSQRYSERQKLQHVYLIVIAVSIIAAGLLSLVNRDLGFTTLRIPMIATLVFIVNAIVWSLLHTGLLYDLELYSDVKPRTTKRK